MTATTTMSLIVNCRIYFIQYGIEVSVAFQATTEMDGWMGECMDGWLDGKMQIFIKKFK